MTDLPSEIFTGLIGSVSGGGIVGALVMLRRDKREDKTTDVDLFVSMREQLTELQAMQVRTFNDGQTARQDAARANEKADKAEAKVMWIHGIVRTWFRAYADWVRRGAVPPPPEMSPELMQLAEIVEHPEEQP